MRVLTIICIVGCLVIVILFSACDSLGTGVCVSSAVEFEYIGLRVYCYDGWSKQECDDYNAQQVNGADWFFHAGQTCEDRGLTEGSNPWP